jgi:hypothetical protein
MSSILKIQSARANGALSHGPVTPEGLARSSQNAITHGLAGGSVVLSSESEPEFQQLREVYISHFKPQTEIEADLVEQLVSARWRAERACFMETALLDIEMIEQQEALDRKFEAINDQGRTALAFRSLCDGSRTLATLDRYETRYRRAIERIFKLLRTVQESRQPKNENLPDEPNYPQERALDSAIAVIGIGS